MKGSDRQANRERWRSRIKAWRASGQRLSTWAREQGFSREALEYWRQQFSAQLSPTDNSRRALTLIPVPLSMPAMPPSPIELVIETRPGLRLSILPGFDAAHLVRLLNVLAPQC